MSLYVNNNIDIGLIFAIKKYSIHDGPGIRTTVFFKGCPLNCWWCHNPEGIDLQPNLIFHENRCIQCYDCVKACSNNAIAKNIHTNKQKCTLDGNCVAACPGNAREILGKEYSAVQLMQQIEKDIIFYDDSDGGVTFSGGEPFLQPKFLKNILKECQSKRIHTAVDTSGYVNTDILLDMSEYIDLFLYDLKIIDDKKHIEYTGVSNELILHNLLMLTQKKNRIIIRVPIIPGINDDLENIKAIGALLASLKNIEHVEVLPYHKHYLDKNIRLNKVNKLSELPDLSNSHILKIKEELKLLGC